MSFYDTQKELWKDWNYSHPIILHGLIRSLKPQVILECGCYRAFSTCWMAKALQENNSGRLYTIDNWSLKEHVDRYGDPRTHAISNMEACGVREWIEVLDGDSREVKWPERVDFAYLDGHHSFSVVQFEFIQSALRGAKVIALDDTENCVGPRMLSDNAKINSEMLKEWQMVHIHGDNGLTLFVREEPKRPITFSQELPDNPGVDLRFMTVEQQHAHFEEAWKVTGLDYSPIMDKTEYDREVGT